MVKKDQNKINVACASTALLTLLLSLLCSSCSTTYRAYSHGTFGPNEIAILRLSSFRLNQGPSTPELFVRKLDGTAPLMVGCGGAACRKVVELLPGEHTFEFEYADFVRRPDRFDVVQVTAQDRINFRPKTITKTMNFRAGKVYQVITFAEADNGTWSLEIQER